MRSASPRRSIVGFVIALVAVSATVASIATAEPRSAQDSAPGAEQAAVDAIFAPWAAPRSPGCALGVVRDGELAYEQGYGSANLDWQIPIDTETVFYVGSVSKQFTAGAIAMLALDGEISLDDDIREYFPETPVYQRPVTVRHLVHHTSGIRDIYTLMALAGIRLEDVFSDEEAIALIAAQRETNFAPGDEYLYSNSGYFLLAQLVERATGKTLREYADERIFEPLGMKDTHFHDSPGHVVDRRAISYQRDGDRDFRVSYLGNFDKVGAGGLYTTVKDMLLWDRNFYTGDVGGDAFLDLIHTKGELTGGDEIVYAFGLNVDEYRGLRTVSHSGSMMGFKAAFLQFPEQRFSVLAACNLGDVEPMGLAQQVADLYLADRPARPAPVTVTASEVADDVVPTPAPFSRRELSAYAGTYFSSELDAVYEIAVRDDGLWLHMRNAPVQELRRSMHPLTGERIVAGGWRLDFERGTDDVVESFTVNAGRVTNIRFVRR